ncbi:ankyrin repeat and SOCS box protein 9-like [Acropora muricata]|uniref:ankyrin repeat and SOCS box protein 9-like n=1 Tax=Acropora muricata TaxID=159855 RepID=UPI0034E57630
MGQRYTLLFTAREGREDDLRWALYDRRISPDLRDPDTKQTALHLAAARGRVGCVRLLMEAGAKCNVQEKDGLTPLHLAVYHGHVKCVTVLIEHGANVNSTSRFGSTPLHQAAYFGHFDCASVLLAAGALANVEEAWGQTPLFLAAQRAHSDVVRILLHYGAYVDKMDKAHFKTGLHVACEAQSVACVQYLLDAGADPNVQAEHGRTPLHIVLRGEESGPLIQLLVEYGARFDILDDSGNSPETILQSLVTRYGNGPNMEMSRSYQQLLQLLWDSNEKPISLKRLCRLAIRKLLSPCTHELVHSLSVPYCLELYILHIVQHNNKGDKIM